MNHEIIVLQQSPRIEMVFYEDEFEMKKSGSVLIDKTNYSQLKSVEFIKGRIPWVAGILSEVLVTITGYGVSYWRRGKGSFEISTIDHSYSVELKNYYRDQTPKAIRMINSKFK